MEAISVDTRANRAWPLGNHSLKNFGDNTFWTLQFVDVQKPDTRLWHNQRTVRRYLFVYPKAEVACFSLCNPEKCGQKLYQKRVTSSCNKLWRNVCSGASHHKPASAWCTIRFVSMSPWAHGMCSVLSIASWKFTFLFSDWQPKSTAFDETAHVSAAHKPFEPVRKYRDSANTRAPFVTCPNGQIPFGHLLEQITEWRHKFHFDVTWWRRNGAPKELHEGPLKEPIILLRKDFPDGAPTSVASPTLENAFGHLSLALRINLESWAFGICATDRFGDCGTARVKNKACWTWGWVRVKVGSWGPHCAKSL